MMIVWLVWEFAESPAIYAPAARFRGRIVGAGLLTSPVSARGGNCRRSDSLCAYGQDPNDVAGFSIWIPSAALLLNGESRWPERLLALGYLPLGLFAVVLTASRVGSWPRWPRSPGVDLCWRAELPGGRGLCTRAPRSRGRALVYRAP